MAHLEPGTTVAGYRIEDVAGEGGMGVVYRATQLGLERNVALKLITPELGEDDEFRERFKRESKTAAAIEHPNVIPVHEAGEADGRLFISMRFIEGTDLRAMILSEGRLEPKRAARILSQVASALDAAHAHGLVHRDIKPANVLIARHDGDDHAFLTDFGLTKQTGSQSGLTRTGTWVGTLDYIAPEQILGGTVDARSDVYALGCLMFHVLSGQIPYQRDSDVAKLWSHMNDPPPRLSEEVPGITKDLDLVIGRAMAKDPDDRYPSASDFARAVDAALEGTEVVQPERSVARGAAAPGGAGPPAGERTRFGAGARRSWAPMAVAAIAGAALTALVLAAAGAFSGDEEEAGSPGGLPEAGVTVVPVAVDSPAGLAIADGSAWVSSYEKDVVTPIDERTAKPGTALEAGDGPGALAIGDGSLWIAQTSAGSVGRLDLERGEIVGTPTPLSSGDGDAIELGEGALWAVESAEQTRVARVDPDSRKVTRRIAVPEGINGDLAVGEGGVWVVNTRRPAVTHIDAGSAKVVGEPITVGRQGEDDFGGEVTVGGGAVWATSPEDDTVARIDPGSREVVKRIRVPSAAGGVGSDLAFGLGYLWVINDSGSPVRIDPESNSVRGRPLPASPVGADDLEIGADALWVAGSTDQDTVLRIVP